MSARSWEQFPQIPREEETMVDMQSLITWWLEVYIGNLTGPLPLPREFWGASVPWPLLGFW